MDFKSLLNTSEYDFLRTNPRLGSRIMLLGVSGSHGYGTNREGSDIDFRGVTLNLPSDLIGLTLFDQYEDPNTDTVIYSFNKLVNLLLNCNPNTIEILGLDEDQYVIKTAVINAGSKTDPVISGKIRILICRHINQIDFGRCLDGVQKFLCVSMMFGIIDDCCFHFPDS